MNVHEKLSLYLQSASDKVTSGEFRQISDALRPILPEVVALLRSIAISESSTMADKKWALEMLMSLWRRCIRDEDRKQKVRLQHQKLTIKKKKADAEDKRATLEISRKREEIAKTLAQAETEIGG
jgi:hypothetical protein